MQCAGYCVVQHWYCAPEERHVGGVQPLWQLVHVAHPQPLDLLVLQARGHGASEGGPGHV